MKLVTIVEGVQKVHFSSTIFGMTPPGIEPRSPGPLDKHSNRLANVWKINHTYFKLFLIIFLYRFFIANHNKYVILFVKKIKMNNDNLFNSKFFKNFKLDVIFF